MNDGDDFGDWQSFPYPFGASPQVQDALIAPCPYGSTAATCTTPTLNRNSNEVVALDAIGYNLQPTPEPTSVWLLGGGVLFLLGLTWRDRRRLAS
ncbi:MAG: PEP-CTERM sorting domain-containing protein [Terriglobales bacterium]